ncbi:hypothetical protein C2845_PM13G07740 [Panicum miliaceum]|uniref:Uncharacterized protein n=1 Tax=Panicum miliaceum TaxID=4540 RepID=A0A3L6RHH3_PANMI|nr:hypothetical protein C2845_PM13G07740 [Panicum miliaceum]
MARGGPAPSVRYGGGRVMAMPAANKADVELRRHGAWWRGGGVAPEGLSWLWCGDVTPRRCSEGLRCSGRKPSGVSFWSYNPANSLGDLDERRRRFQRRALLRGVTSRDPARVWCCRSIVHGGFSRCR